MLRNLGARVSVMCAASASFRIQQRSCSSAAPESKIEDLANMYSQLTLKEITQLQKLIFKKLGHTDEFYEQALLKGLGGGGGGGVVMAAMPAGSVPAAAAPAADAAPAEEVKETKKKVEKNTCDVKLAKFPPEIKIKLIKELRTVTNLPLKDAKDAIDKCPGLVQTNMSKEDAEKLKALFEGLGATVELI
jgi:large subunit ribosomal protein L7/L12